MVKPMRSQQMEQKPTIPIFNNFKEMLVNEKLKADSSKIILNIRVLLSLIVSNLSQKERILPMKLSL